jgi:hypothetical protein
LQIRLTLLSGKAKVETVLLVKVVFYEWCHVFNGNFADSSVGKPIKYLMKGGRWRIIFLQVIKKQHPIEEPASAIT